MENIFHILGIVYYTVASRRPSGLRKTKHSTNSLAHRTTWLRSDLRGFVRRAGRATSSACGRGRRCNSATQETDMENIFHILGIVYYTVALIHLLSEMFPRKKDRGGQN